MKNRNIISLLIVAMFLLCLDANGQVCRSRLINNHGEIIDNPKVKKVNRKKISYREIKYTCVYSPLYIKKALYDKFGIWTRIENAGKHHPTLIWDNVQLFSSALETFTVEANSYMNSQGEVYCSVLIYDQHGTDLMATNSKIRSKLIAYFSELIKSSNCTKTDFFYPYAKVSSLPDWNESLLLLLINYHGC